MLEMKRWLPDVLSVFARKKIRQINEIPRVYQKIPKGYQKVTNFIIKAMRVSKKSYAMRVWTRRYRAVH